MARFTAGQKLRAIELNDATTVTQGLMGGTEQTITTSLADLNSASVTITTHTANIDVLVVATFDVTINGGTDIFTGYLDVDGSSQTGQALANGTGRWTVAQHWKVSLASAGSHTLKLRGQKVNNSNTVKCSEIHTRLVVFGA